MPTPQKEQIVQEMTEKFSSASSIFLVDFTGMDVNTTTELRKNLKEAKVEYRIVKNTLAKLSFHNAGIDGLDEFLKGVNGYLISYDDPTLPAKVLKKHKEIQEKLQMKAAMFEGNIIGPDRVASIAELPSRDELLGQLVGMLQSPLTKLAGTLNAAMGNLVNVLKQLEEKKK